MCRSLLTGAEILETPWRVGDPQGVFWEGLSGHVCSWHCHLSVHELLMRSLWQKWGSLQLLRSVTNMFLSVRGKEFLCEQTSLCTSKRITRKNRHYFIVTSGSGIVLHRNNINRRRPLYWTLHGQLDCFPDIWSWAQYLSCDIFTIKSFNPQENGKAVSFFIYRFLKNKTKTNPPPPQKIKNNPN